jgi:hypothetical protein
MASHDRIKLVLKLSSEINSCLSLLLAPLLLFSLIVVIQVVIGTPLGDNQTAVPVQGNESVVPPKENRTINYLTYVDPSGQFSIDYPFDWQKQNQTDTGNSILFKSPLENNTDPFQETVGVRVITLSENMTLPEFSNTNIDSLEQSGINILDSTPVTLANTSSHRIVYDTNDGKSKIMQTWTLVGQKVYLITYVSNPAEYLEFLPTIQKMVESFKLIDSSVNQKEPPSLNRAIVFQTYENPEYGFKMKYPQDWEKSEFNKSGTTDLVAQFNGPNIRFDVTTLDKRYANIDDVFDERQQMYKDSGYSISNSIFRHVGGYPAYTIRADGGGSTITEYGIIAGKQVYLLSWEMSSTLDYDQFREVTQVITDSFEIIPSSGTNTTIDGGRQEEQPSLIQGFLMYEDDINKFTVQYPSSWQKQENVYGSHGVQFTPVASDRDNVLIDVLTKPNLTLDSWTKEKFNSIESRQGSEVIQSSPTTISGNSAHEVTYLWEGDKIMELWTVIGNRLYAVSYVAEGEEKFQRYLPIVKSIIDSLRINDPQEALRLTSTSNLIPYSNPSLGFSLAYPPDWQLNETQPDIPTFISTQDGTDDSSPEVISITTEVLPAVDFSLERYTQAALSQIEPFDDFDLKSSSLTTLGGLPAHMVVYTFTDEDIPLQNLQVWTVKDGVAYVITYGGNPEEFDISLPALQSLMDSFRLE